MAARVSQFHKTDPFKASRKQNTTTLPAFTPSPYHQNLIARGLSPTALRVFYLLVARMEPDGSVTAPTKELSELMGSPCSYINSGVLQLVKHGFVARRGLGTYWVNGEVVRPVTIGV
ncbi:hypothetical protein DYU11_01640 [Fibrisoma montanum]|uniref:Helix-turn-helix domain-containing protein n=1 Tax=Fibrisoma montanum TaxID=2305895 RepID=A0A418MI00_9BACT|nr:hypothetical protein [Fibrisoma montanum]RIV27046.1 hypothetical protein DYU11_01640 [Fibrisoma montanum]